MSHSCSGLQGLGLKAWPDVDFTPNLCRVSRRCRPLHQNILDFTPKYIGFHANICIYAVSLRNSDTPFLVLDMTWLYCGISTVDCVCRVNGGFLRITNCLILWSFSFRQRPGETPCTQKHEASGQLWSSGIALLSNHTASIEERNISKGLGSSRSGSLSSATSFHQPVCSGLATAISL